MARSKKNKETAWQSFVARLQDERLSKIIAILCFMMALFILVSSISYFFTWKADPVSYTHLKSKYIIHNLDANIS